MSASVSAAAAGVDSDALAAILHQQCKRHVPQTLRCLLCDAVVRRVQVVQVVIEPAPSAQITIVLRLRERTTEQRNKRKGLQPPRLAWPHAGL